MCKIWWTDFAAREFEALDPDKTIAILPIAAVEQQGTHLPVGTDIIINNRYDGTAGDAGPCRSGHPRLSRAGHRQIQRAYLG